VRREWIELYLSDWLDDGFTSFLSPAQMGVAAKLWALAGRMKDNGIIRKRPSVPFTLAELSLRLKFGQALVKGTLAKLEDFGFTVTDDIGIHWTHWDEDQPPYHPIGSRRQLPSDQEPPQQLTPEQLEKQTQLDAKAIADVRRNQAAALPALLKDLGPERVAAAEKLIEARRKKP